jgi:hypothetical protein
VSHKRYLVTGRRKYRWHEPGTVFEAQLDPEAERRAIERGSIRVLTVVHPHLENDTYTLPQNWPREVADSKATRALTGSRMN